MSCYKCESGWCEEHKKQFTDDDLKRLKECVRISFDPRFQISDYKSLLARLEASEVALQILIKLDEESAGEPPLKVSPLDKTIKLWRQAAGKS